MDLLWQDPNTGGVICVGNKAAAASATSLGISAVVNCTDDLDNFCEGMPDAPRYFRFNVESWETAGDSTAKDAGATLTEL